MGRSQALIADGIESSLDVLSSCMMWGAIRYAERPPDHDHPYGHGKMESLAAVIGSLSLILALGRWDFTACERYSSSRGEMPRRVFLRVSR